MGQIKWSKKAVSQLHLTISYIAKEQSNVYAEVVVSRIFSSIDLLVNNPRMGSKEPLLEYRNKEYRYLVVWSYKIIYKVHENGNVLIARIFHTSQNPSKIKH